MAAAAPAILDHLSALSDATRSRVLLLLDGHELTVTELCNIVQLPQSTVSRHLKVLGDSGWIGARAEGASHLYTMRADDLEPGARKLWQVVRDQVGCAPAAAEDQRRLQAALSQRRAKSKEFFSASVQQWDRMRDELFGDRFLLAAMAALAQPAWQAGDLGCGTGQVSAILAPFVSKVVAVDASAAMVQAAGERLSAFTNVELRCGELEHLPIEDDQLDVATLMLVLHHVAEPERAIADVARVLKPGGQFVLVDMLPHEREGYRQQMGHVWLGFGEEQVTRLLTGHGFDSPRFVPLSPDPRAKGPSLFLATARKGETWQQ